MSENRFAIYCYGQSSAWQRCFLFARFVGFGWISGLTSPYIYAGIY